MLLTNRPTPAGRMPEYAPGISERFGTKRGWSIHHGDDYFWLSADIAGSRWVYAAGAGRVTKVEYDSVMGLSITIDHGNFSTRSCHMPRYSALVNVGDWVTDKTLLAPMGNSGSAAGGEFHLHHEVWVDGVRVDPAPYFSGTAGGDITPIEEEKDDIMDQTKYYYKTDGGTVYGIFGATYPGGYETSESSGTGQAWGKLFGKEDGAPWDKLTAAVWATLQAESKVLNQRWVAQQRAIFGGGPVGSVGSFTDADRARLQAVPTALQNGQAARAEIVK